tara:strand:+ start:252 stop:623 length:372 start_codon:yes stop_codon:yes gene_type:complete
MVDKRAGNLDSQRIHSRNVARDPMVREARRNNRKPRKQMPKMGAPTPKKVPVQPRAVDVSNAQNVDRKQRMQQVVPASTVPTVAPQPEPNVSGFPPITSFTEDQQQIMKIMALKSWIEYEMGL